MPVPERFNTSRGVEMPEKTVPALPIRRFRAKSTPAPADVAGANDMFVSIARAHGASGNIEGSRDVAILTYAQKIPEQSIFYAYTPEGGTGANYKNHPILWQEVGGGGGWLYGKVKNDWMPGDTYLLVRPVRGLTDPTEIDPTAPDTGVYIEFDPTNVSKVNLPGWCTWGVQNSIVPYMKIGPGVYVLVGNPIPNPGYPHPPWQQGVVFQNIGATLLPNCKWQLLRLY